MSDQQSRDDDALFANRALLVLHSVRTAAHELNNVFQMISGSAELLLANPALPPPLTPRVESVARQAARGEGIMRSVADLARSEGPGAAPLDLGSIVTESLEMRRFEHRRSGIDVSVQAAATAPVRARPRDLMQIVLNLLLCAEQAVAGRSDGAIRITVTRHADVSEVVIADNGEAATVPDAADAYLNPARTLAERSGGTVARQDGRSRLQFPDPPAST